MSSPIPRSLLNGFAYAIRTYLGGHLTDHVGKRDKGAYAWIPAIGLLITIPAGALSTWAPNATLAFFWTAPFLVGLGLYLGPTWSLVQTLAPLRLRAFAVAFMFFVLNLIALGFGPLWVGAVSDLFAGRFGETTALRIALTTLAVTSLAGAGAYWWTSKRLPADWARATGEKV